MGLTQQQPGKKTQKGLLLRCSSSSRPDLLVSTLQLLAYTDFSKARRHIVVAFPLAPVAHSARGIGNHDAALDLDMQVLSGSGSMNI